MAKGRSGGTVDSRLTIDKFEELEPGSSERRSHSKSSQSEGEYSAGSDVDDAGSGDEQENDGDEEEGEEEEEEEEEDDDNDNDASLSALDPEGFAGPSEKIVKPLTPAALAAFKATQDRAGVIYISRIPPGMRPAKVRHLMSQYGEVGRVYLQQEDPKRAYLRKKFTSTKKAHFTEGWVEFKDKRVGRSVAEMLNAQPIGGKKGTRWRDDVWTMKYLPKFKWTMLTEQIANEAAVHTARLRVELEQSRKEQKDYLHQVELARVLDKRADRKRKAAEAKGEVVRDEDLLPAPKRSRAGQNEPADDSRKKKQREKEAPPPDSGKLKSVLSSIF